MYPARVRFIFKKEKSVASDDPHVAPCPSTQVNLHARPNSSFSLIFLILSSSPLNSLKPLTINKPYSPNLTQIIDFPTQNYIIRSSINPHLPLLPTQNPNSSSLKPHFHSHSSIFTLLKFLHITPKIIHFHSSPFTNSCQNFIPPRFSTLETPKQTKKFTFSHRLNYLRDFAILEQLVIQQAK